MYFGKRMDYKYITADGSGHVNFMTFIESIKNRKCTGFR